MVSERLIHKLRHTPRVCCEWTKLTTNLERHTNIEKVLRHKIVEGMQHTQTQSYMDLTCYKSIQSFSEEVISLHPALHNKFFFFLSAYLETLFKGDKVCKQLLHGVGFGVEAKELGEIIVVVLQLPELDRDTLVPLCGAS